MNPLTQQRDFYTLPEIAKLLMIGESTAYQWAAQGRFKTVKIGRLVRVPAEEVERIKEAGVSQ